jgi:hypothetical protein
MTPSQATESHFHNLSLQRNLSIAKTGPQTSTRNRFWKAVLLRSSHTTTNESLWNIRRPRVSDTGHGSGVAIGRRENLRPAVTPSCPDLVFDPAVSCAFDTRCSNPGRNRLAIRSNQHSLRVQLRLEPEETWNHAKPVGRKRVVLRLHIPSHEP